MITLLNISIIIVFIAVAYLYLKLRYFTLRGSLPGVSPQFLLGNLLQTGILGRGETLPNVFRQYQDKFGDVFQFWLGPTRVVVISRLEDVQYIFAHRHEYEQAEIFAEKMKTIIPNAIICYTGPKYKRHASIINPLLRRGKIISNLDTITDCTDKLLTRWRTTNNDPTYIHLNMIDEIHKLIIDIFGFAFFDYDLQTLGSEGNNDKNELSRAFHTIISTVMSLIQAPTIFGRIYLLFSLKYQRARKLADQYLMKMIEQELQETPMSRAERKKTSLIASLVASLQPNEKLEATKTEENKKGLSRTEVLDEMLTLLVAGAGSTAAAVTWFIYLMSIHPDVQKKVKQELAEYNMQSVSAEQLDSFVYLECVLYEMFRFVPPAVGVMRTLTVDDRLPSTGAQLKKGDLVFIPIFSLGRDPRYWAGSVDPDYFCPERFLSENYETIHKKAAWIPFGGGHRQCIGQDFARFAVKLICARLMQRVTFGDGGPDVNSGEYAGDGGDSVIPKHMGVTVTFDSDNSI